MVVLYKCAFMMYVYKVINEFIRKVEKNLLLNGA